MSKTKKASKAVAEVLNEEIKPAKAPLAKVPEAQLPAVIDDDWGAPVLTSRDLSIPKIRLMQPLTPEVAAGEAKFGELRDSLSGKTLADDKSSIDVVPIHGKSHYTVMRPKEGRYRFDRQVELTVANENQLFEVAAADGVVERWYRTANIFVLLAKDIAAGNPFPYLLSLRSTSFRAGQQMLTIMWMKNARLGPAAMHFKIGTTKTKNDKGTFAVITAAEGNPSTPEEIAVARDWNKKIRSVAIKVDHSDLEQDVAAVGPQVDLENSDY